MKELYQNLKIFLSVKKNWLWLLNVSFIIIFYYTILLWSPYYFDSVGLQKYTLVISMMYPLASFLSALILSYLLSFCEEKTDLVNLILYLVNIGLEIYLIASEPKEDNAILWIIAIAGIGFCTGFGFSRAFAVEPILLTQGNSILLKQVFFFLDF